MITIIIIENNFNYGITKKYARLNRLCFVIKHRIWIMFQLYTFDICFQ